VSEGTGLRVSDSKGTGLGVSNSKGTGLGVSNSKETGLRVSEGTGLRVQYFNYIQNNAFPSVCTDTDVNLVCQLTLVLYRRY